jgi:hypothetical protein
MLVVLFIFKLTHLSFGRATVGVRQNEVRIAAVSGVLHVYDNGCAMLIVIMPIDIKYMVYTPAL